MEQNTEEDVLRKIIEEKATEELLKSEKEQKITKPCPFCGCDNIKPTGCEYVTCLYVDSPNRRALIAQGAVKYYNELITKNVNGEMTGKTINDFQEEIKQMQKNDLDNAFICSGGFNGKGEWCWLCDRPKYQADPKKLSDNDEETKQKKILIFCDDKTHNSH